MHLAQRQLRHHYQRHGRQQHRLHLAALLRRNDGRHHQHKRHAHHRQIDLPVRIDWQAGGFQHVRQHDEQRRLRGMQSEHAKVQTQQLGVVQDFAERGFHVFGRARRIRHHPQHHADGDHGQYANRQEHARHADPSKDDRRADDGHGKRHANAAADHGHGLGAMFLTREVGHEGDHRRGNCPGTLDGPPHGDTRHAVRKRRHQAAHRKDHQPRHDDGLAPEAVR